MDGEVSTRQERQRSVESVGAGAGSSARSSRLLRGGASIDGASESRYTTMGAPAGASKGCSPFDTPLHRGGRKLAYNTKVQYRCAEAFGCNGNLKVGKAYTAMLDLKPGDEFEIRLGKKQICLVPIRGTEEADEEE